MERMDVAEVLQERKEQLGSWAEVARSLGVSRQYIDGILRREWPASNKLLKKLGLERRIERVRA